VTVDLVVNRNARHLGEDSPVRHALLEAAARYGARVHETHSLLELADVAQGVAERGTSGVVLAGGDGSTMAGVTALWRALGDAMPAVALAPGGTVGVVARNLNQGTRASLGGAGARGARLVRAVCEGTAVELTTPTLRVRDDAGGDRVAFIFGAGLVARFFDVYEAGPRQGIGAAAGLAGRALLGSIVGTDFAKKVLTPVACTLEVEGEARASRAWSLVLASVVKDVGLGVKATYRAGERTDRFHAVASTRGPRGLATQVPRVLTGRGMVGEDQVDALVERLKVRFEASGAYVVDGDVVRAGEVTVEAGPVVRVMVG
jgi:diacylglycerol kinase family enzyme